MTSTDKTLMISNPYENEIPAYFFAALIGAGVGTLIGFIIAVSLGETYTIEVETGPTSPDRVGEFHMPIDGDAEDDFRLTSVGGKWTGGGTGIGAAIGLLLMFLYRNFGAKHVSNASSSSSATATNAYRTSSSTGNKVYKHPILVN